MYSRRRVWLIFLGAILLRYDLVAGPITHIVHVSVDGLGSAYLQNYLTHGSVNLPNFARLTVEGAYTLNARCDYFASETIPNHCTMFTGRPVLQPADQPETVHHGFTRNFPLATDTFHTPFNPAVPYKASFMDVVHDHGLTTGFYASKMRLGICDRSYNETTGALDLIEEDNGRDKIDFTFVNEGPIAEVVDLLVENLTNTAPRTYSFIHLREPDITGHGTYWGSPDYSNAVVAVDAQLGRILSAITESSVLSNHTVLIVSTDHGGGGVLPFGHSEPEHVLNYTIPFFLWGPPIPPAVNAYTLFMNRGDPGTNRVEYHVTPQPIRNGDGANLALGYLGLPAIPGSLLVPILTGRELLVGRERTPAGSEIVKVSWRASRETFTLQWTESLQLAANWRSITSGITEEDGFWCYRVPEGGAPPRFFRLQGK